VPTTYTGAAWTAGSVAGVAAATLATGALTTWVTADVGDDVWAMATLGVISMPTSAAELTSRRARCRAGAATMGSCGVGRCMAVAVASASTEAATWAQASQPMTATAPIQNRSGIAALATARENSVQVGTP
jgi:hypothetical protein